VVRLALPGGDEEATVRDMVVECEREEFVAVIVMV